MQLNKQFALQRVAILLVFLGLTSASWNYQSGNLKLVGSSVSTFPLFTFPNDVAGGISISVNSSYDITLCFQATIAPATFTSCNIYLELKANNATTNPSALLTRFDEDQSFDIRDDFFNPKKIQSYIELLSKPQPTQIFTSQQNFLAGRFYWLAATFPGGQNGTFNFQLTSSLPVCEGDLPYGTPVGCVAAPFNLINNERYNYALTAYAVQYVQVVVPNPVNTSVYTGFLNLQFGILPDTASNNTYNLTYYVQRNSFPSTDVYDFYQTVVSNTSSPFSIPTPLPGTYYIFTNNTNSQRAQIYVTASYNQFCTLNSTNSSTCPVQNITTPSGSETNQLTGTQYFSINSSELIFGVGTTSGAPPPIYLSVNESGWPSQYSYLAMDNSNTTNFFHFEAQPINPTQTLFRFGAANPNVTNIWRIAVVANGSQSYYYWSGTYCPYNCSGGPGKTAASGDTCDTSTGKCTCSSSKANFFCQRTGLSVGWIIVIVIIVIIVVACAIGIPLALYLRQRRNKNYERV